MQVSKHSSMQSLKYAITHSCADASVETDKEFENLNTKIEIDKGTHYLPPLFTHNFQLKCFNKI